MAVYAMCVRRGDGGFGYGIGEPCTTRIQQELYDADLSTRDTRGASSQIRR